MAHIAVLTSTHPFKFPDSYPSFASTREPRHRSNRRILALLLKAAHPKENASCKSGRSAYCICSILHPLRTKQRLGPRASNMSSQCDDSLALGALNPIKPRAHKQAAPGLEPEIFIYLVTAPTSANPPSVCKLDGVG